MSALTCPDCTHTAESARALSEHFDATHVSDEPVVPCDETPHCVYAKGHKSHGFHCRPEPPENVVAPDLDLNPFFSSMGWQ